MKITDVKLRFAKHYLFVQVYTDAGIVGLGEAGNWGYLQATAAAIEKFADYLTGLEPVEAVHLLGITAYLYIMQATNADNFKTTLSGFNYKGKVLGDLVLNFQLKEPKS